MQLDSATYRREAHRFYFRERYAIWSYHFVRPLQGEPGAMNLRRCLTSPRSSACAPTTAT